MFGYLNVHSYYSLLRGVVSVENLVKRAKEEGCDALAITDTNNMYGAIRFYKAAEKEGIRPLLGATLRLQDESANSRFFKIIFLAKTRQGYTNVMRLVTLANILDEPKITFSQLKKLSKGVIAILPPENNSVVHALETRDKTRAGDILKNYKKIFGDNLYLGISPQSFHVLGGDEKDTAKKIVSLADEYGVPYIPLPLVYLSGESEVEARRTLLRIQQTTYSEVEEDVFEDSLLFPSRGAIETWAKQYPKALSNLSSLIEGVRLTLDLGSWFFPKPPIPEGTDPSAQLREYIEAGYRQRGIAKTEETGARVDFELGVIEKRGYVDYFLTVIDLARYTRRERILTTTRGSAAGSLVSYLTGITSVNPLEYNLPFERFLNPHRPSPPDIDFDVMDTKRSQVLDYVVQLYGKDKVAQIGTLGTLQARAAVRDTARALGYSYLAGDRIARLIPFGAQGFPMYIDKALKEIPELLALYEGEEDVRHIIDVAKKIEGNPRHNSVHAAGVVIAPSNITEYTPLEKDKRSDVGKMVTQYDMHNIEEAGLLKFDILGISYLSILANAIDLVKEDLGETIDIDNVSEKKEVYEMISAGHTTAIFQLSGDGMTRVLKRLKPETLHDIAAVIALYRPGPMSNIDRYVNRKEGSERVTYAHPKMKNFLEHSYGILVYQDDLLFTAIELAGYDWKEVDVFRKAVGKKIPKLMAEQEIVFKKRVAEKTSLPSSKIDEIWNLFDPFKGYGFNKAHAFCYARLSYQTAYVKTFFPVQYMTAHLQAMEGDLENINMSIHEARRMGIAILPPDINKSQMTFATEKQDEKVGAIRVGLRTIKQVGEGIALKIIEEREQNGPFVSIADFLERASSVGFVGKKPLTALIQSGAFDEFETRSTLFENLPLLLKSLKEVHNVQQGQQSLFAPIKPSLTLSKPKKQLSPLQELYWERELMGLYTSRHPLSLIKKTRANDEISEILRKKEKNKKVTFIGVIGSLRNIRSKQGKKMYLMKVEDEKNNQLDVVCFEDAVEEFEEFLSPYRTVLIEGVVRERKGNEISVAVEKVFNPKEDMIGAA